MTRELIENFRRIILPYMAKRLLRINYEGLGKDDAKEFTEHFNEILNLAIKALEQETCEDCVSRQAAIDAFHTWFRDGFDEDKWWNSTHALAAIEGLPSVQQEHKWETCFECPLSHGCPKIKGCTNEQAIEYASQIPNDCPLSVQPKPKIGHWIPCSERLPKIRQHVLCQCRGNSYSVLRLNHNGDWECIYPHTTYMQSFVLAWMPLPEPYKVDSQESER